MNLVGLTGRGKDRVAQYSKGMVQRLGLAQSLLNDPQLLILDEPTDGLDPRARAEVRRIIHELTDRGVTIFLNSHLLGEVESICDRVAILNKGQLRYFGSVKDIGGFIKEHDPGGANTGVQIQIKGDSEAINASLDGFNFEISERKSDSQFIVNVNAEDQDAVDKLVDALRGNGVSLQGLEQRHLSLEDAFLKIVD